MKNNHIKLAIIGGILTGTALGLLFAPEKGDKTRKKIVEKANNLKDIIKEPSDKLNSKISQNTNSIENQARQLIEKTKDQIEQENIKLENLKDINKSVFL